MTIMKPFSLDVVLKYRKRQKDRARNRYQEAQNQYNIVKQELLAQQAKRASLVNDLSQLHLQGIDITKHIRYENHIELLQTEIDLLKEKLKKKQEKIVRERTFLLKKSQEHKVMDKLKEKQNLAWQQHLEKKEATMTDEMAILYRNR